MKITFTDKKLEKLANDDRKLVKEFGKLRADKIKTRLAQLRFATTLEDVRNLPGNYPTNLPETVKGSGLAT